MKRGIILGLVVAVALAVVLAAAAARDPRLEKLRLGAADMRLARSAVVQRSDLGNGWTRSTVSTSDQPAPNCPGYRPNFSKFTLTGQADAQFATRGKGTAVLSRVEVYATKAHARGDFTLSTRPPVARCLGLLLQRETAQIGSGVTFKLVSARRVGAPKLGERSAAYRIVGDLASGATRVRIYFDAFVVLRGRSIGAVFFTGSVKPVAGQQKVVARMARRLR